VLTNTVPSFRGPVHPDDDELEAVPDEDALEPDPTATGPVCKSAGYPKTTAANSISPTVATAATFVLRGSLVGTRTAAASGTAA